MSSVRLCEDYSALSGSEKAALFMLSLSEEQTLKIFNMLDEEEIKDLSQAMSTLGKVGSTVIETMFVDFSEQISATGALVGSFESTERLLTKVLTKDKVNNIMEEIRGPAGRTMWDKLGNVNEDLLANYLKNEYPQTVAVVLSRIKPEHAAKVLALFPDGPSMEVVLRMLRMESVQKDILDDIEKTLRHEFMNNLARSARRDSHEMIADIFNYFDRATETRFISALEERNQDAAERIKALMFTFNDLLKIDKTGIQNLLKAIDKSKLAMALKGATEPLKDLFFKNMSERSAKLLKEDMLSLGMVRIKDVDETQAAIVAIAKEMANRGEILIVNDNDKGSQLIG